MKKHKLKNREMKKFMEKEKVLEIEITKINEMYSCWYVKKVNKIKLKAMPLTEIGTDEKNKLCFGCGYKTNFNKEYIGDEKSHLSYYDYQINLEVDFLEYYEKSIPKFIENKYVEDLKQVIDLVNDLYGIQKRWRAEQKKGYFYIHSNGLVDETMESYKTMDNQRYELGNYFRTEKEAQKIIDSKEWQEFWERVKAGEIGK